MYSRYIDNKKDKNILLIHSIPSSSKLFDKHLDVLSSKYNILLIDLPGFGKSKNINHFHVDSLIEDVLKIISDLNLKNIDVWGVSLGGIIATILSEKLAINRLILESTPIFYGDIHTNEFKYISFLKNITNAFKLIDKFTYRLQTSEFLQNVVILMYKIINIGKFTLPSNQLKNFVNDINLNAFFEAIDFLKSFDNRDIVKELKPSLIVVVDKRDKVVLSLKTFGLYRKIDSMKILEYDNGVHAPSCVYGKLVSKDVLNLLLHD